MLLKFSKMRNILIIFSIFLNLCLLNFSYTLEKIDGTPFFQKEKISNFKKYKKLLPSVEELNLTHKIVEGRVAEENVGDERKFWCYNFSTKKYYQISAVCKLKGEKTYIYLEKNKNLSLDILEWVLNKFEDSGGIYNTCRILGETPDVDMDGRITILFLDIIDNFAKEGVYISGYFSPINEYPKSVERYSNQREIIYIEINQNRDYLISTIAHELQHMIHWNYDPLEEVWVEEGCSVFAEFLCKYPPHPEGGILSAFRKNPDTSLTLWEDKLQNYGITYLFILYIFEKCGGTFTIREIVQNKNTGIEGIEEVLKKKGSEFLNIFKNFIIANYLDEKKGIYGYNSYEEFININPNYTYTTYSLKSTKDNIKLFSGKYYEFVNPSFNNPSYFYFGFRGVEEQNFLVQYIVFKETGREINKLELNKNQAGNMKEENFQKILIVTSLISGSSSSSYIYSLNDIYPPNIFNIVVRDISQESAVILWETDEDCFSYIEYTSSDGKTEKIKEKEPDRVHKFFLNNLKSSTHYTYWCISTDTLGNTNSYPSSFQTLSLTQLKSKAFPNPAETVINFTYTSSPFTSSACVEIYNIRGKLIKKIPAENPSSGKIFWDFSNSLPNGVYIYILKIIDSGKLFTTRGKFVVLK